MTVGEGQRPLWIAGAAAFVGVVILALCFSRVWQPAQWTVRPKSELIAKGRQVSAHFGFDSGNTTVVTTPKLASALTWGPQEALHVNQHRISPLSLRVFFTGKGSSRAETVIDSGGLPLSWRAPAEFKGGRSFASDDKAAQDAFQYLAGGEVGAYGSVFRSPADDPHEEEYTWRTPLQARSGLRERIRVSTADSVVKRAERRAYFSSEDDSQDSGGEPGYWSVLSVIFGVLATIAMVIVFGIYVLWLVRRVLSHRFPLRLAIAALAVLCVVLAFGTEGNALRVQEEAGPVIGTLFQAIVLLMIVAVGRSISAEARPKWISLEQLFRLAPIGKTAGAAMAAGVLFSPLLLAIPFLMVACGWFGRSSVISSQATLLYSASPLLDSLNLEAATYLLGFFGFAIPALWRVVRVRWLFWVMTIAAGVVFFAVLIRVVTGPVAAPLIAGAATFAIYGFVYYFFDLLAVLTLQLASNLVMGSLILWTKGIGAWSMAAVLAGLLIVAFWWMRKGATMSQGDPAATIPALADFRAEREKLKAEFSLARRAQQDMLPQTPPAIPGYTIAGSCTPSLEVGGDLYDFLRLPDGRVGIGVADVSGKGVPAALYMTLTKGLLSSVSRNSSELVGVVEEVNRHLHGVTRKKVFVTMALGFLDAENRVLECVRAGHNPVVWRQAAQDVTKLVAPGGLGLGITASRVFSTQLKVEQMALSAGDAVVFYSDGITEAMNRDLEQFGEERLMSAVQKTDRLDACESRDSILSDVHEFLGGVHPQDDMTLVVLRVGAA